MFTLGGVDLIIKLNGQYLSDDIKLLSFSHDMQDGIIPKMEIEFDNHDYRFSYDDKFLNMFKKGDLISFQYGYLPVNYSRTYDYAVFGKYGLETIKIISYPNIKNLFQFNMRALGVNYISIVTKLASEMGLTAVTEPVPFGFKQELVKQNNETSLKVLKRMADNIQYEFNIDDKVLIFRNKRYTSAERFYSFRDNKSSVGSVLSFTPDEDDFGTPEEVTSSFVSLVDGKYYDQRGRVVSYEGFKKVTELVDSGRQ
jgi:hypothetical protein